MACSRDDSMEQEMCSVYSAQPSETNCSISEVLAKEIVAVNEVPDDLADVSLYSLPKSETNVTMSDVINQALDVSVYSAQNSETPVTMSEKFQRCKDLMNVLDYSVYSAPPSETNVTLNTPSISEYSVLQSETNVTMSDGFHPCKVINSLEQVPRSEYTARPAEEVYFDNTAYVEHLQAELGISDRKLIGLECSNLSITKIIDSNECLLHLEQFHPIPVDFSQVPDPISFNKSMQNPDKSVEGYLRSRNTNSLHHKV